jgi:hypothetical protein
MAEIGLAIIATGKSQVCRLDFLPTVGSPRPLSPACNGHRREIS